MTDPEHDLRRQRLRRDRCRADPARRRAAGRRLERLDGKRRAASPAPPPGPAPRRAVSRHASAAARHGDRAGPGARRVEPAHPFAPSARLSAANPGGTQARSTTSRSGRSATGPLRCLLQIVDVTVMAGRERILRERQNARYDAVVDSAPDAILTLDAEGVIQLANPAAAREFGYAPDELIGQPLVLPARGRRRVGRGLRGHPRRRDPAAARSSSRRGARTARRAISRCRRRAGRAKAGSSSPPSCATSTSGAWPSRRCAC